MISEPDRSERLAGALAAAVRKAAPLPAPVPQWHDLERDLALLHREHDPARPAFISHRRRLGPAIIAIKNLARELLSQVLARQARYNGANARIVSYLHQRVEELSRELEATRAQIAQLRREPPRSTSRDPSPPQGLEQRSPGAMGDPPGSRRRTPPSI